MRWKIKEKRELNLSLFDLILERFDSNLKETNTNDFLYNLPKRLLKEEYNLNIPEGLTPQSLKEVLIDHVYERLPDFIPRHGQTVIDVGAQFGDYAYLCAMKFGAEVFSFEPLRKNYEMMVEFLRINRVNNVHAYNIAIGAEDGIFEMMGNTDMI
ncbi:MAG: FkbM family methyltransferase, partial [Methanomassiliicoccales archaeon]|nr:FkbM family methyltransferase [Methanomassiliicoccales archaeon]